MTPVVSMPVSGDVLLTAAEYQKLPDPSVPTELVRGRVIERSVQAAVMANSSQTIRPMPS